MDHQSGRYNLGVWSKVDFSQVVPPEGLEPPAYCLEGSRSIQLSYEGTGVLASPSRRASYLPGK